jgi:hypothetical protein
MRYLIILLALSGCATNSHHLPTIECKGKGTITGSGNASVMVGSASNSFTIQADCGTEGFTFKQVN